MRDRGLEICESLEALIPELCYGKETHRLWSECDQKYRDENPDIGDVEFHKEMVKTYQIRIDTIVNAIMYIYENHSTLSPITQGFIDRLKSLTNGAEVDLNKPLDPLDE